MTEEKVPVKSRGWCYTCNNYTYSDLGFVLYLSEESQYHIVAFEVGTREGTPHLQGYVYFYNQHYFSSLKKIFPNGFSFRAQTSKNKVAPFVYCMKDLDYWETGKRPRQGKRSDLDAIYYDIQTGRRTCNTVMHDYYTQWCFHRRSFKEHQFQISNYETKLYVYQSYNEEYAIKYAYEQLGDVMTIDRELYPICTTLLLFSEVSEAKIANYYYSRKYKNIVCMKYGLEGYNFEMIGPAQDELNQIQSLMYDEINI